jgi:hypothetical protein
VVLRGFHTGLQNIQFQLELGIELNQIQKNMAPKQLFVDDISHPQEK